MVQLSHLVPVVDEDIKKSAASSCGITSLLGSGSIQLSNREWLKNGSMESNALHIKLVSINYG